MKRLATFASIVAFAFVTGACSETDAGVTSKVKAKFAVDDVVKASDINVTTQDHVVTLSGAVNSAAAKAQAVRLTRETEGVRDVVDDLVVGTSGTLDRSDKSDKSIGDHVDDGASATGNAIERGAEATGDAIKDAGNAVKDAVTDNDRDSDKDGK